MPVIIVVISISSWSKNMQVISGISSSSTCSSIINKNSQKHVRCRHTKRIVASYSMQQTQKGWNGWQKKINFFYFKLLTRCNAATATQHTLRNHFSFHHSVVFNLFLKAFSILLTLRPANFLRFVCFVLVLLLP